MPTSSFERIVVSSGKSQTLNGGTYTNSESYAGNGGAAEVQSGGTLNTNDAVFTSNQVTSSSGSKQGKGGAIYNDGTTNVSGGSFNSNQGQNGGAIFNSGAMTISGATFSGNSAGNLGGAIYNSCGTLNVTGGTFSGNDVQNNGGGIYVSSGTLNVSGASFIGNNSPRYGGAISLNNGTVNVSGGSFVSNSAKNAAAIYNYSGSVEVIDATFSGNTVTSTGGAIYTRDMLYVSGGSFVGNSAGTLGGAIYNLSGGTANVSGAAFSGNVATSGGGAIYNLSGGTVNVFDATFSGNTAGTVGGAIYNLSGGTVNVSGGSFFDNVASQGGAIYNASSCTATISGATFSGNSASHMGGAIYNLSGGAMTISGVTFSGNSAGLGGAIENDGGTMAIFNATFAGNSASFGGAIDNFSGAVVNLSDVNFSGNVASLGGAILNEGGATVNLLGAVTLATASDDIDNASGAVINWDLTNAAPGSAVVLNGYQNLSNKGDLTITVNAAQTKGDYTIATGSFDSIADKQNFTLKTADDEGTAITVGGTEVNYKGLSYTLAVQNGNALVLNVSGPIAYTLSESVDTTYDGTAKTVSVTVTKPTSGATVYYSIDGGSNWTEGSQYSLTDAGSATVCFKIAVAGYLPEITGSRTINISQKNLTVTGTTVDGKTYDGNTDAVTHLGTVTGVVTGDDVTVTAKGTFADKNAENGKDVSIAYTLTGEKAANYTVVNPMTTADIEKRDVTLTSADDSKVYDGTPLTNDTMTVGGSGWADGEGATYTVTGSQTAVGSSANTFTYTLNNGTLENNYTIDTFEGTLTVTQRAITLRSEDFTKEYDGTALVCGGTITDTTAGLKDKGYVSGEEFTYSFSGSQLFVGSTDNEFEVSDSATSHTNDYNVTKQYGKLTVTGRTAPLTITVYDQEKDYDGTAVIDTSKDVYSVEGLATGDTITVTITNTNINAGTYEDGIAATYTIMHDNGDGTQTDVTSMYLNVTVDKGDLTINKKALTITGTTADEKAYDGNTDAVTHLGTVDGVVKGDDVTVTAKGTFADKNAENGKDVSIAYTLSGTKAANYTVVNPMTTADITKRAVTLTSADDSKVYDGTPLTNDTMTVGGSGWADGEGATYTVTGSQTAVGSSANTFTYTLNNGTLENNYTIETVKGTLTVTQRAITLRSEDFTKEYDGTALVCGGTITDVTAGQTDKGYVSGEEFAYSFSGSQLFVGSSDNEFEVSDSATAQVSNYDVTSQYGKLSVTPRTSPLTITVKDQTKLYDGNATIEAAAEGVTYTVDGELASGDTLTVTLVNTNVHAGTYADGITATYSIIHPDGTDVTKMYANVTVDAGDLTVNQRSVTLTSGSAEKDCDGLPLTNSTVTVSGDGWLKGEGATYDVTGSQTEIGTSKNTFTYELNDGTLATDYAVTKVEGTLTVNSVDPMIIKEGGTVTISEDCSYEEIQMARDAELTVAEGTTLEIGSLTLEEGSSFQNDGTAEISALNVTGKDAAISGNLLTADTIILAEGAELGLDKDQYDSFMAGSKFGSANGKLIVSQITGNALRTQDVDTLMNKANVTDVEFEQDLIDVSKLNVKSTKEASIGFRSAYGTTRNDTIRFCQGTNVTLGIADGEINLEEGSNTIQIDKNATTVIRANLTNVSTIKSVSGSVVELANIDFQAGRNATLKAEGTSFKAGTITGTDRSTTVTIGKATSFSTGSIALAEKNDKITANKDSIATIGSYVLGTDPAEGTFTGASIDFGAGNDTLTANGKVFAAGAIDFGAGNNTLSIGKDGLFLAAETWEGSTTGEGSGKTAAVTFGDGKDTIKTGQNATVIAGNVSGAETISIGACSEATFGSVDGTTKLTLGNGKEEHLAALKADAITGTEKNDSFSFGNWSDVDLKSIAFGDGNDALKIGSNANVDVTGYLDFGDGKSDSLSIGSNSTLSVDSLNVDSLDKLSMSKDATLCIRDTDDCEAAQEKWSKYADQIVSKLA